MNAVRVYRRSNEAALVCRPDTDRVRVSDIQADLGGRRSSAVSSEARITDPAASSWPEDGSPPSRDFAQAFKAHMPQPGLSCDFDD